MNRMQALRAFSKRRRLGRALVVASICDDIMDNQDNEPGANGVAVAGSGGRGRERRLARCRREGGGGDQQSDGAGRACDRSQESWGLGATADCLKLALRAAPDPATP